MFGTLFMGVTLQILDADRLYSNHARTRWEWLTVAHRGRHSADDKLDAALASGLTVRDAADVAERTATRRMADAGFRRQVVELRSATVRSAAGDVSFPPFREQSRYMTVFVFPVPRTCISGNMFLWM